ncbi:MAG: orotate phosphoribosyltransferase [Alphaproteobacteria bacterium]|jgi:orotate phosphoribosyltransferase|nr:orotate phosphoribosyltransferase [Alphaproteobacteria bacterium]MBU1559253.1 orotate phosphoribosyltransferase [Alphaproteobacteria bacterium]MBU2303193.1 orotate phosphoribosyltransferase [Alphaproteobacteria bacterium]MBU2366569.1 orotate phosphoribosyltransferase [Alphaproteobacteria bacterium]
MTKDEVLAIFRDCGAMLEGHFILSSGLRSPVFLQKAKVFQYASQTEKLCKALAEKIHADGFGDVTKVVSPAIGGIIPGYETSRHLGVPALYTERVEGKFELRRGFEIAPDDKVIVVEDIVSTGLSIRECVEALRAIGANVVAAACLIDRSGGEADVGVPLVSLIEFKVPAYPADQLPPELAAIPAVKPGSRGIQGVK